MGLPSVPSAPGAAEAEAAQGQGQSLGKCEFSVGGDVMLLVAFDSTYIRGHDDVMSAIMCHAPCLHAASQQ